MVNKLFKILIGLSLALSSYAFAAETEIEKAPVKVHKTHKVHKAHKHHKRHKSHKSHKSHKKARHARALRQQLIRDQASLFTLGPTVTTSPYIGIRTEFDASDLVVNLPSMNEDLRLLKQQQTLVHRHAAAGMLFAERPIIELSGDVVGQALSVQPYKKCDDSISDINLSDARFDVFAHASSWALAYLSINFDNSRFEEEFTGSGFRVGNSRIFLKRAFLTLGNLDCSPFYFSLGQMYVPFGRYSTSPVTTALTVALGQTNERAALLGVSYGGFFGSVYGFSSDSFVDENTNIDQWGVNAGYQYKCDDFSIEFGGGYIANLADSAGMQLTSFGREGGFQGFGLSSETENLQHKVPAVDAHIELGIGKFDFNAEYIAATKEFAASDLAFNCEGAKPTAFHIDGTYHFCVGQYPASFSLAYGMTEEALALNLPKESYFATVKTSLFKNTIESLEFRHDVNYDEHDTSAGLIGFENNRPVTGPGPSGGGSRNVVLLEVGVYF